MQRFGDVLIVIVISAILWAVTAAILLVFINNVISTDGAKTISISLATLIAIGFFAFWRKGRSLSEKEDRANEEKPASDLEIVRSYGSLFAELDPSMYIYDSSLLPYPKYRILRASTRVLKRPDTPDIIRVGAVFAKDLANFQDGVGATPLPTKSSIRFNSWRPNGGKAFVEQHALTMARYKPSPIEIRADLERERTARLVDNAILESLKS